MDAMLFRTRVTALWLAVAIALSGSMLVYMSLPGALEEMLAGEMEGDTLTEATSYLFATLVIIPLVMAGVTLLVGHRASLYTNLTAGLVSGLSGGSMLVGELSGGGLDGHSLMAALAVAGVLLIAGLSLAGLRRPTSRPPAPAAEPGRHPEATTV